MIDRRKFIAGLMSSVVMPVYAQAQFSIIQIGQGQTFPPPPDPGVTVFEVTMVTASEISVEIRDAPITHGTVVSAPGIASVADNLFSITNISASPIDGSVRLTTSGAPFTKYYFDTETGSSGLIGVVGVVGGSDINGSWDTRKIDVNICDIPMVQYTSGWSSGTGKVCDYTVWTDYAPVGRRGIICGPNFDYFRSCALYPSGFLNRAAAAVAGNWSVTGKTVTDVYIKSKNYDHDYVDGITPTDMGGLGQFAEASALKHFVTLKLNSALTTGTYTIANSAAGISTTLSFNDRVTRAICIRVSGVGHAPGDASKLGYLSMWNPGAANHGAYDYSAITTFDIVNDAGTTVGGPYSISTRILATEAEELTGIGADNLTGGYGNAANTVTYNSTASGEYFDLPTITVANPAVFTTNAPHGFIVGDFIRFYNTGSVGTGNGIPSINNSTSKILTVPTSTTFTAADNATAWNIAISTAGIGSSYTNWTGAGQVGKVAKLWQSNRAGTNVYALDYSAFTPSVSGNYRLRIAGIGVSDPIAFQTDAWRTTAQQMAKGEYYHRWGIELDTRFGQPVRPTNFIDGSSTCGGNKGKIYQGRIPAAWSNWTGPIYGTAQPWFANQATTRPQHFFSNGTGGYHQSGYGLGGGSWADAGDWVTRVDGICFSIYTMCELVLLEPTKAATTNFNVPTAAELFSDDVPEYTGMVVPDLLNQAIFGMECYRRMQHGASSYLPEGSVSSGLNMDCNTGTTPAVAPGAPSYITPNVNYAAAPDHMTGYCYAFAAAKIAQVLYSLGYTSAGDLWKDSAIACWDWCESLFQNITAQRAYYTGILNIPTLALDTRSMTPNAAWDDAKYVTNLGVLDSNAALFRVGAAGVLYRLTLDSAYATILLAGIAPGVNFDALGTAQSFGAWDYGQTPGVNPVTKGLIYDTFAGVVTRMVAGVEYYTGPVKTPCRTLMIANQGIFFLGTQGTDLSIQAFALVGAHVATGDVRILKMMQDGMGYNYGANPIGMSFVAQVGNRWPGTIFNFDNLANGVECYPGIGCYGYSLFGSFLFAAGAWGSTPNCNIVEVADPLYPLDFIFERMISPGRYATPMLEAIWEGHYNLSQMERSVQQDVFPLLSLAFYLYAKS